ncbi:MAG: Ig-like domain-containing protein, partial [Deltaproteobacteria bacterium]
MKEVKQFFSSQIKSICLLFTIVAGGILTLSSCSPACDEGNYLGTVEECEVTADAASDSGSTGGGSGGSTGGSTGGSKGGSTGVVADTTAPIISSYAPSNSATNIAIGDNLTVTFLLYTSDSADESIRVYISVVAVSLTIAGGGGGG